jgi:hypothetical protein
VIEECFFLANHRAGCNIKFLSYEGRQIFLDRAVPTAHKKFDLQEFLHNSKSAASEILSGDFLGASKWLDKLLLQFEFEMAPKVRSEVLKSARKHWLQKTQGKDRDVSIIRSIKFICLFIYLFIYYYYYYYYFLFIYLFNYFVFFI